MSWQDDPVVETPSWQKDPVVNDKPTATSRARGVATEVARPVLKTAAGLVSFAPDALVGSARQLAGKKTPSLGTYLDQKIDKYLPKPEGSSAGLETATELVLGAMTGGGADAEFGAQEAAKTGEALFRASRFVEDKVGIAWDRLPGDLKQSLAMIARKPKDLAKLDPKLVASEANSGKRVSELVQSDLSTLAKAEKLPELTAKDAGANLQSAMRTQLKDVKGKIDKLYDEARAKGETAQPVDTKPLADWLSVPANVRNAPWLASALKDYAAKDGKVTVNDLESIRAEANAKIFDKSGGGAHFAVEAKKMIDQILDKSGGALYKTARAAQAAYKNEWVRQGVIRKLSTDKPGTSDPRIALESTIQSTVIRGSAADLASVKATLAGKPVWKDLQAGAVDYLKEVARSTSDPTQFNNRFLDRMHDLDKDGKLTILFGEDAASHLRNLAQTVRQLHGAAAQPEQAKESAGLIMSVLDHLVGHIPVAGRIYRGAKLMHALGNNDATSLAAVAAKAHPIRATLRAIKRSAPEVAGATAVADSGAE